MMVVMLNPANILTLIRIGLIPVIAGLMLVFPTLEWARMLAFILYSICGITDYLDGWLARKYDMQSNLGKMLDPIADKLLIAVILMILADLNEISGVHIIPACVILCREILVSGLREYLGAVKKEMPVTNLAKWKTTLQIFALGFFVIGSASVWVSSHIPSHFIGTICLWLAAILTLYTGYFYLRSGIDEIVKSDNDAQDFDTDI